MKAQGEGHRFPQINPSVVWGRYVSTLCCYICLPALRGGQVMGVVGPSSVADGLPLLHLSPYLSPPLPFSTAVVRLVALQIQVGVASVWMKLI